MNFSFFCKHCGKHLRQGDHRKCKEALRREAKRKPESTSSEKSQRYLAKIGEGC